MGSRPLSLTSTLPVGQVWGHSELPPLSHTHALQAPVQTFNHFVIAKGGLLRGLIVVAVGRVDSQVSSRGVWALILFNFSITLRWTFSFPSLTPPPLAPHFMATVPRGSLKWGLGEEPRDCETQRKEKEPASYQKFTYT